MPDSNAERAISTKIGPEIDLLVEYTRKAFAELVAAGASPVVEPFEIQIGYCAVLTDPWRNQITVLDATKGLLKADAIQNDIG